MQARAIGAACAAAAALALPGVAMAGGTDAVKPFGKLTCVPTEGVRFCEGSVATRVATFDGVPLDVNVTLPATRVAEPPADRPAPRLGRQQERAGLLEGVGRGRLRGAQLHRARVRELMRVSRLAHGRSGRLRPRLGPPRRLALRGPRHAVPRRPAGRSGPGGAAQDRGHRRLVRRRPVADPRNAARPRAPAQRQVRPVAQPEGEADGDRGRRAGHPLVRPRALPDAERRHARHRGHEPDRRPRRRWGS